jgi:hypothetical protein
MDETWAEMSLDERIEDLHQRLVSLEQRISQQVDHDQAAIRELGRRVGALERRD